ncbi:hypothetical protein DV735_g5172, partial [Chaetothyriales sp. CBS 134920]
MFLSRRYRPNIWPFHGLAVLEFGLTVGLLVMAGIADPNTYRTKLWQYGSDHCWNSSPQAGLYAAANYRSYHTPIVWSQFITHYILVIVILSMFILLVKVPMYMLHVFPPILSALVHAIMTAIYAAGVAFLAGSDNTDRNCPSNGPVWYITKSCSVVTQKNLVTYCKQAKATLGLTATLLAIFAIYLVLAIWSCFPSKAQKQEYLERKQARESKWAELEAEHEAAKREGRLEGMSPVTADGQMGTQMSMHAITPRTAAFNQLGGAENQPQSPILRTHFSSPNQPKSPTFQLKTPALPKSPLSVNFGSRPQSTLQPEEPTQPRDPQLYFPPPPTRASKK